MTIASCNKCESEDYCVRNNVGYGGHTCNTICSKQAQVEQ